MIRGCIPKLLGLNRSGAVDEATTGCQFKSVGQGRMVSPLSMLGMRSSPVVTAQVTVLTTMNTIATPFEFRVRGLIRDSIAGPISARCVIELRPEDLRAIACPCSYV